MNTTLQIGYRTLALEYVQTREQWLERAAAPMRESLIPQLAGHRCRVSCGWPHKAAVARTARRVGECWFPQHSTDHTSHNLFISPLLQHPIEVLQTLAHELVHVAAGPNAGHKGAFLKIAKAIGFKAPWTSTPATGELIGRLNGLLLSLGPYPHAAIDKSGRKKQWNATAQGDLPGMRVHGSNDPAVYRYWAADLRVRHRNGSGELKGRGRRVDAISEYRTASRFLAHAHSQRKRLGTLR